MDDPGSFLARPGVGRAVARLADRVLRRPSAWFLVAANLVPLGGVLVAGWDVLTILFYYWLESLVVGLFAVPKLAIAARWGAFFLVPFFCVHYGMFMLGHLLFIVLFFGGVLAHAFGPGPPPAFDGAAMLHHLAATATLPALALVASHGFSFVQNYLRGGEWRTLSTGRAMMAPYGRILVMHAVLVVGGIPTLLVGSPAFAVALLVVLKTAADLRSHLRERDRVGAPTPFGTLAGMPFVGARRRMVLEGLEQAREARKVYEPTDDPEAPRPPT